MLRGIEIILRARAESVITDFSKLSEVQMQISQTTIDSLVAHALSTFAFSANVMADDDLAETLKHSSFDYVCTSGKCDIFYDIKTSPDLAGYEVQILHHFGDDVSCWTASLFPVLDDGEHGERLIRISFASFEDADRFAEHVITTLRSA